MPAIGGTGGALTGVSQLKNVDELQPRVVQAPTRRDQNVTDYRRGDFVCMLTRTEGS
jgi:hypothetical protein